MRLRLGAHVLARVRCLPSLMRYTSLVVRRVAVVVLIAFALLAATDKFACPDGCNSETDQTSSTQSSPHGSPHTCVLCVLGVEAPVLDLSHRPVADVSASVPLAVSFLATGTPLTLDHPPRQG